MTTKPATLTTIFEYCSAADGEIEFAKLWYIHPADSFQESRILGVADSFAKPSRLTIMSENDALATARRVAGADVERRR